MRKLLSLFVGLFLVGCSTISSPTSGDSNLSDFFANLNRITNDDIDAAMADAVANNDLEAIACYPVLKQYVNKGIPVGDQIKGIISLNQKKRDVLKSGIGRVPSDLKIACAAYVQDERDFLIRMGVIVGVAGATKGMLPMIP